MLFIENEQKKEGIYIVKNQTTKQKFPWDTQEMGRKTTVKFPMVTEENQRILVWLKIAFMEMLF